MRNAALAAILSVAVLPAAARAEIIDWKTVGGWEISFDTGADGCRARAVFEEGTAFHIGFDATTGTLALNVRLLDRRWASIEDGREYEIEVRFGDETPWTLAMDGMMAEGMPGLDILIDVETEEAALFAREFQREAAMAWRYAGTLLGNFSLRGSRRALDETIACQRSYLEAISAQPDPFAAPAPFDPFAQ